MSIRDELESIYEKLDDLSFEYEHSILSDDEAAESDNLYSYILSARDEIGAAMDESEDLECKTLSYKIMEKNGDSNWQNATPMIVDYLTGNDHKCFNVIGFENKEDAVNALLSYVRVIVPTRVQYRYGGESKNDPLGLMFDWRKVVNDILAGNEVSYRNVRYAIIASPVIPSGDLIYAHNSFVTDSAYDEEQV